MTQQTKMPEPVAYLSCNTQTGQPEWSEDCVCQDNVYSVMETGTIGRPVIFADQAEAYKDACVREALEWQPIETAPKHTEVLVWREDSGPFIAKLTDPYEVITVEEMERENMEFPDDFEEWYSDAYGWQEGSEKPTHWMPLPPPPTKESKP